MKPKQIAIIDDDQRIIDLIKEFTASEPNLIIKGYNSGAEGLKAVKINAPDVLIIDLGLGDITGEQICQEVRAQYSGLPILILTGNKELQSVVNCLNLGADDYITKPFNVNELIARINARLRGTTSDSRVLQSHDLTLDQDTMAVSRAGREIVLTPKEFELLRYLLINKSRVMTREKLLDAVWGYTSEVFTRSIDVHVGKLRKKIDGDNEVKLIESLRGFGYKLIA